MDFLTNSYFWLSSALAVAIILLIYVWRRLLIVGQQRRPPLRHELRDERLRAAEEEIVQLIPSPPRDLSERLAADRRQSIRNLFERFQITLDARAEGRRQLLPVEFLEVPPTFRARDLRERDLRAVELEKPEERAGQMARLQWQLSADHLLLAERVVDAIVAHARTLGNGESPSGPSRTWRSNYLGEYPLVRISSHDDRLASEGLFPWKVIIETDAPSFVQAALLEAREWFGIGVEIAPRRRIRLFGKCQIGAGLFGVAGGVLEDDRTRYPMTCSHILSDQCRSVVIRGSLARQSNQPDAALIRDGNPCFPLINELVNCTSASDSLIERMITSKTAVEKRHPDARRNQGVVRSRVSAFELNGNYCRFPHLEVIPWNSDFLRSTRLFDRPFSKEGESGSWVFEVESDGWLGMVIGGDDDYFATFVAEAGALVNYFENTLGQPRGLRFPLQPKYQLQP
jgi:hypothetical protein